MTESFKQLNELMAVFGWLVATLFTTATLQSNCIQATIQTIYYHHQIFIPALCVVCSSCIYVQSSGSARRWSVRGKHLDGCGPCGHLLPLNLALMENILL